MPGTGEPLGLREALGLVHASGQRAGEAAPHRVGLACSFTPLHFETFVCAYLARERPDLSVATVTGIYGDLPGTIDSYLEAGVDSCVAAIEWADLDPRLGWREAVGAPIADVADIGRTAQLRLDRIAARLEALGARCRIAVALPTLDLPAAYDGGHLGVGQLRARLDLLLAEFTERVVATPGLHVVRRSSERRDLRSEIRSGFPHPVAHASALARACVDVLVPPPVKKGLITDLDDTLWRGLVGEVGPDAVTWDLDSGSQAHALYQQLLAALSERGVLVAAASKNDPDIARKALDRPDLLIAADRIFPVVASWNPKSLAVDEILEAWNIAASDVVFVDDSPMELAEVAARHPDLTTILFPTNDPGALADTLGEIAGLLWREEVTADDRLRLDSLRSAVDVAQARDSAQDERAFLEDLAGRVTIRAGSSWREPRVRELVNKTNQFNLNGRRFDEAQWRELCTRPEAFAWSISYEDRFGPLGTVAVLAGVRHDREITVDCWVLSCRAFSRAIEHQVLAILGEDVDRVVLDLEQTDRNGVLVSLLDRVAPADERGGRVLDDRLLRADAPVAVHAIDRDTGGENEERVWTT